MQIRPATEVDLEPLVHVWHDAWHDAHAHLVPKELTRIRTRGSFRARLVAQLSAVRVAGPTGTPVGFHVLDGALLDHLYVTSRVRGTGVAALLLSDAEQQLAEHGFDVGWLTCAVGNGRAARFYEKHGWQRVASLIERAPTPLGTIPVDVWRYEKRVRSS